VQRKITAALIIYRFAPDKQLQVLIKQHAMAKPGKQLACQNLEAMANHAGGMGLGGKLHFAWRECC
jgi:hypothetical protein